MGFIFLSLVEVLSICFPKTGLTLFFTEQLAIVGFFDKLEARRRRTQRAKEYLMVHSESEQQWLARMQRHTKSGGGADGMVKMTNGGMPRGPGGGTGRSRRNAVEASAPEEGKTLNGEFIDDVSVLLAF